MNPSPKRPIDEILARTMEAIEPYRHDVVMAGGFAKLCYQYLPGFVDPGLPALQTKDIDLAMPEHLALQDRNEVAMRKPLEKRLVELATRAVLAVSPEWNRTPWM